MTRRDVLLRLHKNLLARRDDLCKKLAGELSYLHEPTAGDAGGDSADLAFEADGAEVSSRLAELGDRELGHIERALARWQQGTYGLCAGSGGACQKKIPVDRLKALPYTPLCISCEREREKFPDDDGLGRPARGNWGQVFDTQAPMQDRRINLSEMEMGLSGSRRG